MKFIQWYRQFPSQFLFVALIAKLVLFRFLIFGEIRWVELGNDALAVAFLISVVACITINRVKVWLQTILALIVSVILLGSGIYYNYYGNFPTYKALSNLNQVGQLGESISASFHWGFILFFIDFALLIVLYMLLKIPKIAPKKLSVKRVVYSITVILLCGVAIYFSVANTNDITNEHVLMKRLGVFQYQLAVAKSDNEQAKMVADITIEKIAERKQLIVQQSEQQQNNEALYNGVAEDKNVIVIQLEAFQNVMLNLDLNGQEITPNLNELARSSFYFPYFFQQIGEGNTSDAEFISNTSIYPGVNKAMSSLVGGKEVPSLPRILVEQGYEAWTFHVNDVTFWQRDEMYPAIGFTKYFDKPYYENDQFNSFGASDEQLYKVAFEELSNLYNSNQPFYAQIVTVSSHHSFKIPEQYREIQLPQELENTQLGHYIQAIHYTDKQLGLFIDKLKETGMWENTVLALYGDHFGLQTTENDPAFVSEQLGVPYHDPISRFNVPFILHVPEVDGEVVETAGGQVDIMPTIANVLGVPLEDNGYIVFGSDLLNVESNVIGMRYYMPNGTFFNDEIMFVPGTGFEDGYAINYRTLEPAEDYSAYLVDYQYILSFMQLSDLYVTQFPQMK